MDTFPANSHNPKARIEPRVREDHDPRDRKEPAKAEKVITGTVKRRKKSIGARLIDTFGGEDGRTVMDYVIFDLMVPAFKDLVYDVVTQTIERSLGIDNSGHRRRPISHRSDSRSNGRFDYNGLSSSRRRDRDRDDSRHMSRRARADHDFEELVFESSFDAKEVLRKMNNQLDYYEIVLVSDFYGFVGVPADPPDERWGWSDLDGARVVRLRNNEGFVLDLPRPESMD